MEDLNNEFLTRRCNNADWETCREEYFTARTRNQFYCNHKCRDDFNNRKKRELRDGNLPIKDGIIVKLHSLGQSNKEVILTSEQINEDLQQFIGEYTKQIDLSNNAKGIYFLEIETNNGVINKKLILQ
jgi:hypothetical protein